MDDLGERVEAFGRLELPGQPIGMHMGTLYLVNELWAEVKKLRAERDAAVAIAAQKSEQYVAERKAHDEAVAREVVLRKALEHIAQEETK